MRLLEAVIPKITFKFGANNFCTTNEYHIWISTSNNPTINKIYAWEVAYLSLIFTQFLSIKHYSNERLCHYLFNFFFDLSSCFKRLAVLAAFPHGWSFFGKVGGAIMTWNTKILYHDIALGQCDHFITSEVQNLLKIGVASQVGVAKASWWGSRPTNWIGSSTCAFPCSACNCNGLMLILGFYR